MNENIPLVRTDPFFGSMQAAGGIGGLLARTDTSGSTYYHCDGNGNVTMLVSNNGAMLAKYLYDPVGNTLGMWGMLANANVYRFSSEEYEPNSGLYYYGYRFYDPTQQRWLNRDPIEEGGGINLYRFVNNNSVNWIDGLGLGIQPPIAPPSNIAVPGGPDANWTQGIANPGRRIPFIPDRPVPGRAQPILSWDPDGGGHWDLRDGIGHNTYFDRRGCVISAEQAHSGNFRKPKSGPGSRLLLTGTSIVFATAVGGASGLSAVADNGSFQKVKATVQQGGDADDAVFDMSIDAAVDSGNEGALHAIYGGYYWAKKSKCQKQ